MKAYTQNFDIVIVRAGPAGIGMAMELGKVPGLDLCVLESDRIGESFRRWPSQTRLVTSPFYSKPFGLADLNTIDSATSPAVFAGAEHSSGEQYADYLALVIGMLVELSHLAMLRYVLLSTRWRHRYQVENRFCKKLLV